jgi:hypothetical protein
MHVYQRMKSVLRDRDGARTGISSCQSDNIDEHTGVRD